MGWHAFTVSWKYLLSARHLPATWNTTAWMTLERYKVRNWRAFLKNKIPWVKCQLVTSFFFPGIHLQPKFMLLNVCWPNVNLSMCSNVYHQASWKNCLYVIVKRNSSFTQRSYYFCAHSESLAWFQFHKILKENEIMNWFFWGLLSFSLKLTSNVSNTITRWVCPQKISEVGS